MDKQIARYLRNRNIVGYTFFNLDDKLKFIVRIDNT